MDKLRLLFVHKDQKSKCLSSSSGAERKQIHRHVHIGRSAKQTKKLEVLVARSGSESSHTVTGSIALVKDADISTFPTETSQVRSKGKPQRRQRPKAHGLSADKKRVGDRKGQWPPDGVIVYRHNNVKSLTPITIRGSSPEPFDVLAVPADQGTFSLLQFFEHISHPRTWYPESRMSKGHIEPQDPPSVVIQSCLEDEMSTLTMLATSATQMRHLKGHASTLDDAILISRALTAMRKYVSSCRKPDQRLITGDLYPGLRRVLPPRRSSCRTHMHTVKRLSEQLGGLAALQPHLQW